MTVHLRPLIDAGRFIEVPRHEFVHPQTQEKGWCYVRLGWNRSQSQCIALVAVLPPDPDHPAALLPVLPQVVTEALASVLTPKEWTEHRFRVALYQPANAAQDQPETYAQVTWDHDQKPVFDIRSPNDLAQVLDVDRHWLEIDPTA